MQNELLFYGFLKNYLSVNKLSAELMMSIKASKGQMSLGG